MATDINKTLNLDTAISNLDVLIQKIEQLNGYLNDFIKTATDAAKSQEDLNKAQKQGEDIVNDSAKGVSELEKLQQQQLKTAQKLEVSRSQANEELIKNKVALQEVNAEVKARVKAEREAETSQQAANKALNQSVKTIRDAERQNKALRLAIKNVDATTEEGRKTIENYNKVIEKNDAFINQNSDSFIQQKRNIGNYQSALEGAIPSLNSLTSAAKAFLMNPIGATIAAIVGALNLMKEALNSTEEGQMLMAQATGIVNGLFTALKEITIELTKPLIALFTDPQKAINDFVDLIKTKVLGVFESIKNIGLGVGKILSGIWERDLDKIKEGANDVSENFVDMQKSLNPVVALYDKIVEKSGEILQNSIEQGKIEKERYQLEQQRTAFIIREAELSRDIATARERAANQELNIFERKKAIEQAEKLIKELSDAKIADKQRELDLLIREQGLSSNNLQDNREAAQLQAEIINLQAAQANQLKGIYGRRQSINLALEKTLELKDDLFLADEEILQIEKELDEEIEALFQKDLEREIKATEQKIKLAEREAEAKKAAQKSVLESGIDVAGEAFGLEKEAALAKAGINVSEGITKALASRGILGIAEGVLIAAAGAVQIAKIAGTNAYYKGTKSAKKGLAEISERGAEIIEKNGTMFLIPDKSLVNLSGGERIYNAEETRQKLFNDSGIIKAIKAQKQNIIVNIQKESFVSKYAFKA